MPEKADLMWTPQVEVEIEVWQRTGVFPFINLYGGNLSFPPSFPKENLRLLYHVASVSSELDRYNANNFTIWTRQVPLFLRIGMQYDFVLHALLALSATHLAWLTKCSKTANLAYEHRGTSITGLHEAIGSFSRQNSDAVLAASLILSWQESDWDSWTKIFRGTSSIIDVMRPWKNDSLFRDFIEEQIAFPTTVPSPILKVEAKKPKRVYLSALQRAFAKLHLIELYLKENTPYMSESIQKLMAFIQGVRMAPPNLTAEERFEILNPLRAWLLWRPVTLLQQTKGSPSALITLAYYYTVALVVAPFFPEVGATYFGSLSLNPIGEITRQINSLYSAGAFESSMHSPYALMRYPVDTVFQFESEMGWVERHTNIQSYHLEDSAQAIYPKEDSFSAYNSHFGNYNPGPSSVISSDPLSPVYLTSESYDSNQYARILSPEAMEELQSPASSSFGENRNLYCSEQEEFALFDEQIPGLKYEGNVNGVNEPRLFGFEPIPLGPVEEAPLPVHSQIFGIPSSIASFESKGKIS